MAVVDPLYEQGFEAGFSAAIAQMQSPEPQQPRKVPRAQIIFAAGTFVAGLGGAASIVLATSNSPHRQLLAAASVMGILLSSTVAAVRVLNGEPTPQLGLKAQPKE